MIDAVLTLVSTDLYNAGKRMIDLFKSGEFVQQSHSNVDHPLHSNIGIWPSSYGGIAIICNRITKPHRDTGAWSGGLDLLASLGTHQASELHINTLGVKLTYNPGTLVALSGAVLEHSISE